MSLSKKGFICLYCGESCSEQARLDSGEYAHLSCWYEQSHSNLKPYTIYVGRYAKRTSQD